MYFGQVDPSKLAFNVSITCSSPAMVSDMPIARDADMGDRLTGSGVFSTAIFHLTLSSQITWNNNNASFIRAGHC